MTARTRPCDRNDARKRHATARAYFDVGDLIADEELQSEMLTVAVGVFVLAGIAASDAICCARLLKHARGQDHRQGSTVLASATPDGRDLAKKLDKLLALKDTAHYSTNIITTSDAANARRWARDLVDRAAQELQR